MAIISIRNGSKSYLFRGFLILDKLNDLVWTGIFLPCVLLCGLLLSLRSRFLQLRLFPASLRQLTKGGRGDGVSPVQAASTALASTLGTGNIVGTAQAIAMGGPGAVFWMWAAALLGMAVKFAEISLSVATRRRDGAGYSGGPMYYIGSLGKKFRPLALMYALLAALSAFGIGNLSQISSAAGAVAGAAEKIAPELDPRRLRLWLGVILTLTAWLILRGGAAGVGRAAERLVPSMAGLFLLLSLFVLCCHAQALPAALRAIVTGAFSPRTAVSGIGGFGTAQAIQWGLRRGAFSNEAGLGSSAIAHGSAAARSPGEQGLWGIFEVFADTIVICTATALTILCSGVGIPWGSSPGAELLLSAWETCIPAAPAACFMALSLLLFAFTSVLGWALYGTQCVRFLWGEKAAAPYRLCFSLAITVGCLVSLRTVWAAADLLNGLMAIPNFIALFALSGKAAEYSEI